jgi:hypothetical protein
MNHVVLIESEVVGNPRRFKAKFYSPSYAHMIESSPVDTPQNALRDLADKLDRADERQAVLNEMDGSEG